MATDDMTTLQLSRERALVRELARQVAGIAGEARMAGILRRWHDVNALRRPDRAPVWCRPVGCWAEILPPNSLQCCHPWLRALEYGFRQILYKRQLDDDTPVDNCFAVPAVFDVQPANYWGVDITRHHSEDAGGAWAYEPSLKGADDFARLQFPTFTYNPAQTQQHLEQADDLLGDLLPVQLVCHAPLSATLGTTAADLRGLEQMMLDMCDAPELLHRLMAYLRDATLRAMEQVEATGLLTPNTAEPMTTSDPLGVSPSTGGATFGDCWCMANSQEFDQVSPAMWEEYCLAYQRPILARFGAVAYGCCENLTRKLDGVLSIPNLRVVVCSAWTNLDVVLERVGKDYCIMWRQKASAVVFPEDTTTIRRDLEHGLTRLRGHAYQIVLRELETLAGHPNRLAEWVTIAKELAEKYA